MKHNHSMEWRQNQRSTFLHCVTLKEEKEEEEQKHLQAIHVSADLPLYIALLSPPRPCRLLSDLLHTTERR